VAAHLAHGDYFGACGAHSTTSSVYTLQINSQPQPYEFDVSALGALILPGRAYTLVFTLSGPGILLIGGSGAGSSVNSGVAQADVGYGSLEPVAESVPFKLKGIQRISQTDEHDVISQVSMTLHTGDGQSVMGSASVTSQAAVPGEWFGAVPGEAADIHP